MNSELSKRISMLADSEDVEGMTQLLLDWRERDAEWLLFVDIRIAAPSSSKKQKDQLKQLKSAALTENPPLEDEELFGGTTAAGPGISNAASEDKKFTLTVQDKKNFEILETLEELEECDPEEIEEYLACLDYHSLDAPLQHAVNKYIYWLKTINSGGSASVQIANSSVYKQWQELAAPKHILANSSYGVTELKNVCLLENEVELIRKRDYYAYLLENEDYRHGSFEQFVIDVGGLYQFDETASVSDIRRFEKQHSVSFPDDLVLFFQELGQLNGTVDNQCRIYSLKVLEYLASDESPKYERLQGLGLVNMLESIWRNSKDDFTLEVSGLSSAEIDTLNSNYKSVGYIPVDDNVNIAIYFDEQHKFGAVWYNQDDGIVFNDYLHPLLKSSQAQYSCCQLFSAIQIMLGIPMLASEYESFISSLRADST